MPSINADIDSVDRAGARSALEGDVSGILCTAGTFVRYSVAAMSDVLRGYRSSADYASVLRAVLVDG